MRYLAYSVSSQLEDALPSFLEDAMGLLSYMGGVVAISIIALAIYFFIRRDMAVHILMLVILTSALGTILQWMFKLSPPSTVANTAGTALYSFPDLHVARITGTAIFICFFTDRKWVKYVGIAAVALVSLSRLHGETAYVRDIVGGLVLGIACVWFLSRTIKFFRPVVPEITPSAFAAFFVALTVSGFGLFKIFMPSGNGGADLFGLPGGLIVGHYLSAVLYPPPETGYEKERAFTGFNAAIALAVLGFALYLIYNYTDPMAGIKKHVILIVLGHAAGALSMIIINIRTGNEPAAGS